MIKWQTNGKQIRKLTSNPGWISFIIVQIMFWILRIKLNLIQWYPATSQEDRRQIDTKGRDRQQKSKCIWGHTNWARQTDWPGAKERREMRRTNKKKRERRGNDSTSSSHVHSLSALRISNSAHPHTGRQKERGAGHLRPCRGALVASKNLK